MTIIQARASVDIAIETGTRCEVQAGRLLFHPAVGLRRRSWFRFAHLGFSGVRTRPTRCPAPRSLFYHLADQASSYPLPPRSFLSSLLLLSQKSNNNITHSFNPINSTLNKPLLMIFPSRTRNSSCTFRARHVILRE